MLPQPGYTELAGCSSETKARYIFTVVARRHIGRYWKGAFVPTIFLVISSWAGFFIKHTVRTRAAQHRGQEAHDETMRP